MENNKLVAENFCKKYMPDKPIFENVSFEMKSGHVYGLVAPNGSGKTTLMKCIAGGADFTGKIEYNETGVGSHFNGQIVHSSSQPLFENCPLKVTEYLCSVALLKGIRFEDALEKFRKSSTSHLENSTCKELSTGQKKLFQLFLDFLSEPEVVLLDEPLNGLDHQARRFVSSNFSSLAKQGKIVLVSTHVFSDIESLTDKVFIVKDGLLNFYEGKKISEVYDEVFPFENKEEKVINF